MQIDFHYYATFCAAYLAGYTHKECMDICYSAQFVDMCSRTYLKKIKAPSAAATTQLQLELMDARNDRLTLQDMTRIWASFHFLPYDLYAKKERCTRMYLNRYRLICDTNGELVKDTVNLAKGGSLQSVGIAMHVLADTWAHRYFAGTPSLVINNINYYAYEIIDTADGTKEIPIKFRHSASKPDDIYKSVYTSSIYQFGETSIMNLGHGRAGHLPDYSYIKYKYMPAWGEYEVKIKDNPADYMKAFAQMVYAMQYLRGDILEFETDKYAWDTVKDLKERIDKILRCRRLDASEDWKALAEELSGKEIEDFRIDKYQTEYVSAGRENKNDTFLGKFIIASLAQKSMITNKIYKSGNKLAGISIDYEQKGFKGIKDYIKLVELKTGSK